MTTPRLVMYLGRTLAASIAVFMLADALSDNNLSVWSRLIVISIATLVFGWVTIKQGKIAYRYEGWPLTRDVPFRWVVTFWFASIFLLMFWITAISLIDGLYSTMLSTTVWLIFAEATLWFFGRWLAVGRPQLAGPGETGAGNNGA